MLDYKEEGKVSDVPSFEMNFDDNEDKSSNL